MKEKRGALKSFFGEFKKFITRGNVLDLAVGVMVGGAFTAIVNALSNYILKPLINWLLALLLGKDTLSELFTFLKRGYDENGALSLENSIYIDWGAFINAIVNFLLIAFVLFCIVKAINKFSEMKEKAREEYLAEKAAVKKYRGEGLKRSEARARYAAELAREKAEQAEEKRLEEERAAKAREEEEALAAQKKAEEEERERENHKLLEEIRDLLRDRG